LKRGEKQKKWKGEWRRSTRPDKMCEYIQESKEIERESSIGRRIDKNEKEKSS
jgi:hypothetical protein